MKSNIPIVLSTGKNIGQILSGKNAQFLLYSYKRILRGQSREQQITLQRQLNRMYQKTIPKFK